MWILRAVLVVAIVAFLGLFVRVAAIGFTSGTSSLQRVDRSLDENRANPAAAPTR